MSQERLEQTRRKRGMTKMTHKRDTTSMHLAPRCGAKTRRGHPCRAPAIRGKKRCRKHGGAYGSGAPKGNQNAVTHGLFTTDAIAEREDMKAILVEAAAFMEKIRKAFAE